MEKKKTKTVSGIKIMAKLMAAFVQNMNDVQHINVLEPAAL